MTHQLAQRPLLIPAILLTALLLSALLTGCGTDGTDGTDEGQATSEAAQVATEGPVTEAVPEPTKDPTRPTTVEAASATPAGSPEEHLTWFLGAINGDIDPTIADLERRFTPEFLAAVPPAQLLASLPQLRATAAGRYRASAIEVDESATALTTQLVAGDGTTFDVSLQVEAAAPGRMTGLLIQPAGSSPPPDAFDPDATIESIAADLDALAARSALGVYDVTDGECVAVHELRADHPLPIGSTFKLWILAELADQIDAGETSWDAPITIVDQYRSSPDSALFGLDSGTEVSARDVAGAMISTSDNTATDHLLAHVGRERVEQALARIGVVDHGANVPLLSTANVFRLKFSAEAPNADDYRGLAIDDRRAMLVDLDADVAPWVRDPARLAAANADGVPIDEPRDLDLEWYATPGELCRTLLYLGDQAERPGLEPVAQILEANPGLGLPFDTERFPTIRFKGGSEPGVVAGAWWFERDDGRRFVIAGGASDPDLAFPTSDGALALAGAVTLIS